MNTTFPTKILSAAVLTLVFAAQIIAQDTEPKKVNFGYSRNPSTKTKAKSDQPKTVETEQTQPENTAENNTGEENYESRSVAQKTLDVAKRASRASLPPTEIYKVGVGDVLFISLQNAPAKASTYFTVLNDGTIDYPLAGEMVSVAGLMTEEIEEILRGKIKLYENPQVSVKVREFASHSINVLGFVENAGRKSLQREAVPLFVIKAEAIVKPKANQVVIRRAAGEVETFDLADAKTDDVLILSGDIIEFAFSEETENAVPQYFYIAGEINSAGQKDFHKGMTLTQAIYASGGLSKSGAKKVFVRRKNAEGLLISTEYNLKNIMGGKLPDPEIAAGDIIEIGD